MDAGKIQFLQKAQVGLKQACKFVEALDTKAKKDLEKDFRSSSGNNCPLERGNDNVLVLSQNEVDKQKNDLEQSQTKVRFLEKKLSMALEIIAEQKAKLDGFENQEFEIERLKKTIAILQKACDESNKLNLENMENIERLHQKTKELNTDLVIKDKQAETIRIENETLQRELNTTLQSLLKVQQEENMLEAEIKATKLRNETLTKELTDKEQTVQELESTQDQHTIEVKDLKQEIQTLVEDLKEAIDPDDDFGNDDLYLLHDAATNGQFHVSKILLQNGADVNAKNNYHRTPLHLAVFHGHSKIAKLLLQNGALVNAKCKAGETPLHFAAYKGHSEVVEILLEFGASRDLKDDIDRTPLSLAEYYKKGDCKKVIALLKQSQSPAAIINPHKIMKYI